MVKNKTIFTLGLSPLKVNNSDNTCVLGAGTMVLTVMMDWHLEKAKISFLDGQSYLGMHYMLSSSVGIFTMNMVTYLVFIQVLQIHQ